MDVLSDIIFMISVDLSTVLLLILIVYVLSLLSTLYDLRGEEKLREYFEE